MIRKGSACGWQVPLEQKFCAHIEYPGLTSLAAPHLGPCWLWGGHRDNKGYGRFLMDGRERLAHRVAWEIGVGPLTPGLVLDHLCCVRCCVNPRHLEEVTQAENLRRGIAWHGQAEINRRRAATRARKKPQEIEE